MRSFAALLLPVLAVANPIGPILAPDAGWADAPDPKQIQIDKATFSGNGCPQGSVSRTSRPTGLYVGPSLIPRRQQD